jgi:hypothetical protein
MNAGARLFRFLKRAPGFLVATSIVGLSFALAFAQRPGRVFIDTRIELTEDPVRFLHSVTSVWSSTGDLGHVQSGQFVGYLVPMAPWYAFAHTIGLGTWVAQRIWLGSLLAAAGLGASVLLRELLRRSAPVAQLVAAILFLANPYVVVVIGRTSVWLVTYGALPWLLFATHRGIRNSRRWRWPAVIGLLLAVANGGANAALQFWIVLAPPALIAYEVLVVRDVTWRAAGSFAWRAAACTLATSLWWVIPVLLQSRYSPNPLPFTEQPAGILTTPSVSESLRLLGFWLAYFGTSAGPSVGAVGPYLFDAPVIVASFLVPLAAIAGFARARRWTYGPFLMALACAGVIFMSLGFPPGSPLNGVFVALYYHSTVLQVLRTTWKAAPLLALPMAFLVGLFTDDIIRRARAAKGLRIWRLRLPAWGLVGLAAVPVLWALPLFDGSAIDAPDAYGSVPSYWRAAVRDATNATTTNQRIMILPGELFGWYRWGATGDSSIAPFLTPRRVMIREIARFSDLRSSQLQTAIDDLVQQNRLVPGQLQPLLELLGVGSVLVSTDGNLAGDGSLDPADVATALRDQSVFQTPAQSYGGSRTYTPMPGRDGVPVSLPDIRRHALPSTSPGVVRVQPVAGTTILDGDGSGIAELAAEHMLDPGRAVVYAGDVDRPTIGQLVASGAQLVFSDSNRLRILAPSSLSENVGPTLEAGDPIAPDTPNYDLFPSRGAGGETVAEYSGLKYLRTPALHPSITLFPEDGPYAALDGNLNSAWLADPQSPVSDRYIELQLNSPMPVPSIQIYPLDESIAVTTQVAISVNGGAERLFSLSPGWNTVPINAAPLRTLRVRISGELGLTSAGGISELQIPGLPVRQALRLPTDLAAATQGLDLSHSPVAIMLARTTADFPYREEAPRGSLQRLSLVYAADAEPGIRRIVTLPTARSFTLGGWASVRAAAPDPLLDRLAHLPAGWQFSSSDRFEGVPINRASSAFDGDPNTAWVATFVAGQEFPWIQWSWPRAQTIHTMRLTPGANRYEFPTGVRLTAPGVPPQNLVIAPDGTIVLSHPIRTREVRLQVLAVRNAIGQADFARYLNAVAIAEIRVPHLDTPSPRRHGAFTTPCGALSLTAGGSVQRALVYGTLDALDQGEPLRLRPCGVDGTVVLDAGTSTVDVSPGPVMQPDHVVLTSPAPQPLAAPATPILLSAGTAGQGSQEGIRPSVSAPSWLVLGESYSSGWRAWCRDAAGHERALGAPIPINGFANGWRIDSTCVSARMAFAPQSTANLAYLISAVAGVLLLGVALGLRLPGRIRRRLGSRRPALAPLAQPARGARTPLPVQERLITVTPPAALAWAIGVGAVTGFVFALRFGAAVGPLTFVLLLSGISVRRLLRIAIVGMISIPVLYVARPVHNYGGYSFYLSLHQIVAHWIGAGVVCALLAAAVLQMHEMRVGRRPVIHVQRTGRVPPRECVGSGPRGG